MFRTNRHAVIALLAMLLAVPQTQGGRPKRHFNQQQTQPSPSPVASAAATPAPSIDPKEGRFHAQITIAGIPRLGVMHSVVTLLIPKDAQFVTKLTIPAELISRAGIFNDQDKINCFFAEADADGDVLFPHVPPGKYRFCIFTREMVEVPTERKVAKAILARYFTSESVELLSNFKTESTEIEIRPGEETKWAYHFDSL
jgi:hypothetical protein